MEKETIFKKPAIKSIILYGLPVIIGFLGIFLSLCLDDNLTKYIIIALVIILVIVYLFAAYYYGKAEKIKKDEITDLTNKLNEYKEHIKALDSKNVVTSYIVASFTELTEEYANNINRVAKNIINTGMAQVKYWNVPLLSEDICKSCCHMLEKLSGLTDISVGFISSYKPKKSNKMFVKMIAHSNPATTRPNIYKKEMALDECDFYFAKLLRDNNSDINAIADKDKLKTLFVKKGSDLDKYSQYIAVPIMCDEHKLIGVLQIDVLNDKQINSSERGLREIANSYVVPYGNLLLLIHKVEKGLLAQPNNSVLQRKRVGYAGKKNKD